MVDDSDNWPAPVSSRPLLRGSGYAFGVLAVLLAGLCGSSAGVSLRHVDAAGGWQILFYRSLSFTFTVFVFLLMTHGRSTLGAFSKVGWPGVVVTVCLGIAFVAYVFSMLLTTVANAVFIISASPVITTLLGWRFLNERVSIPTWLVMAIALLGVGVMLADGLFKGTIVGSLVALVAALGYSASVVAFRRSAAVNMLPATCLAGLFATLLSGFMVRDFAIGGNDLGIAVLLGTVQIGFQYILITLAARHIPAVDITLLMLSEVLLAPLWVWIFVGEAPGTPILVGGFVVVVAVGIQATLGLYRRGPRNGSQNQSRDENGPP